MTLLAIDENIFIPPPLELYSKENLSHLLVPLKTSHPGAGLHNFGVSCFMNSALQCLSHTTPLANYFMEGRHSQ